MAGKPAIAIVPGSFSVVSMYFDLVDALRAKGFEVYVNSLPSSSRCAPEQPASLSDDAEFFRNIFTKMVMQGKDLVVIGHSYGGVVASEAVKGLSKTAQLKKGQQGGVVKLVFLAAIVLPVGQSLTGDQGKVPDSIIETDDFGFMRLADPAFSASRMYNVWSEEKGLQWARAAPKQSALSFVSPVSYAGYKDIPSCYILTEDDGIIPAEKQEQYLKTISLATNKETETHRIRTNHIPNLTALEVVTEVIARTVSEF